MPTLADKIAYFVKQLPLEKQEEVLEFVENIGKPRRSLLDLVKEIEETIPEDVLERLPKDGAENHDHYLYGAPKK